MAQRTGGLTVATVGGPAEQPNGICRIAPPEGTPLSVLNAVSGRKAQVPNCSYVPRGRGAPELRNSAAPILLCHPRLCTLVRCMSVPSRKDGRFCNSNELHAPRSA